MKRKLIHISQWKWWWFCSNGEMNVTNKLKMARDGYIVTWWFYRHVTRYDVFHSLCCFPTSHQRESKIISIADCTFCQEVFLVKFRFLFEINGQIIKSELTCRVLVTIWQWNNHDVTTGESLHHTTSRKPCRYS